MLKQIIAVAAGLVAIASAALIAFGISSDIAGGAGPKSAERLITMFVILVGSGFVAWIFYRKAQADVSRQLLSA